jgi:hypothetical protein
MPETVPSETGTSNTGPKLDKVQTGSYLFFLSKVRDGLINLIPVKLRPFFKWGIRIFLLIILIFFNPPFMVNIVKFFIEYSYYIKLILCFCCFLTICYELLNLYLLDRFIKKKITISKVLPDYVILMLEDLKSISEDPKLISHFKKTYYIQIFLYIIPIIITIITLMF